MKSHSKIIQNTFGEVVRKETYKLGDLVSIYRPTVNAYVHALIIDVNEKQCVTTKTFRYTYTVVLQNNDGSTATHILKDITSLVLYLPEMKDKLNEKHIAIKNRLKTFP